MNTLHAMIELEDDAEKIELRDHNGKLETFLHGRYGEHVCLTPKDAKKLIAALVDWLAEGKGE